MCTVTWQQTSTGYFLFFNRDELRSRAPATPPELYEGSAGPYIAPIDTEAGGTWLAANNRGVTVGLLNYYASHVSPEEAEAMRASRDRYTSRGLLVLSLADASDMGEVIRRLEAQSLNQYRPFLLLALAPGERTRSFTWNGQGKLEIAIASAPVTTSGYEPAAVVEHRRKLFSRMAGPDASAEELERYHRSQIPEPGAFSVALERPEARTVSMSHINVSAEQVTFRYTPGNPAHTAEEVVTEVGRA